MMKISKVRTPGNKVAVHKKRAKVGIKRCANCNKNLHGIPKLIPSELKKLSKTKRTVNRIYGGYFCGSCTRDILKEKAFSL